MIDDERPAAALARRFLSLPEAGRHEFLLRQPPEMRDVIERAVAAEMAIGWRATPATMGYYLDRRGEGKLEPFQDFRYAMLLGQKFRDAAEGISTRQIWNLPPQYGKSTVASQWGPVWYFDRFPQRNLILSAYGDNLTRRNSLFVLRTLREHHDVLRVTLQRDQQQQDRFSTSLGGGLLATTIDGEATGFSAHGVIIDDPFKNWQDAHSANRRRHVVNQYRSVFRMRQTSDEMFIIVVMTRWHEDDLAGVLYNEGLSGDGEEWELVRLPEIAEEADPQSPNPITRLADPLDREPGEILEPRRFGEKAVAARRLSAGPYLWAGMHQQRPAPEEGDEIKRAWWKIQDLLPPTFDEIITSWDMKLKDKEAGDYVAGGTWGRVGSHFWLFAILRGQWNQATTENAIALAAVREPRARLHVVENTGNGPEVMTSLREAKGDYEISDEMAGLLGMTESERAAVQAVRRMGIPNIVGENVPQNSKPVRMRAHSGLIEGGSVHLWSEMAGLATYLEEMSAFPNGANDDQVDMTSQALSRLRTSAATITAPKGDLPKMPIGRRHDIGDIRPNLRYR